MSFRTYLMGTLSVLFLVGTNAGPVGATMTIPSSLDGVISGADLSSSDADVKNRQVTQAFAPDIVSVVNTAAARWEVHCLLLVHSANVVMFQPNGGGVDEDGDGFEPPDDCDDLDPAINPDAEEICDDGVDNNCDGQIDEDMVPPEVTCPEDLALECGGGENASEIDAWLALATADDNCEVTSFTHDFEGLADGCGENGPTTVTWIAVDAGGNQSSCSADITLEDTTDPQITADTDLDMMWPPNHRLMNVGLTVIAEDLCDAEPEVTVEVVSDEDEEGPGNHNHPDAMDVAPDTLQLRAERDGDGDGRVYLILVTAEDACGNKSQLCMAVTVPHDQSAASMESVAAQAAAAVEAECPVVAPPPNGFFMTGTMLDENPKTTPETDESTESGDKTERFLGLGCGAISMMILLPGLLGLHLMRWRGRKSSIPHRARSGANSRRAPS